MLNLFLGVFGTERVKVLLYDELVANPGQALRAIFAFLGVREDAVIDTSVRYNVSGAPKSRRLYTPLNHFIFNPSLWSNASSLWYPYPCGGRGLVRL